VDEKARKLLVEDLKQRPWATHPQRAEFLNTLLRVRVSEATVCRALGLTLPLLELLDDLALLLGRSFGGLHAGGGIPPLPLRNLVARLGIRLVSLTLLYAAAAVYAHAFSFLTLSSNSLTLAP
jgi:hypothetical protein